MLDAVRAEALKMRSHRGTWGMVWIYPILVTAILIGVIIYRSVAGAGNDAGVPSAAEWIRDTTMFWHAPGSAPGRILVAAFTALVFASEYNWNTWKLIVPVRTRWHLIVAKWLVIIGFVIAALLLTNIIVLLGEVISSVQGSPIPEGVTFSAIVKEHARAATYALVPIIYAMSFATLVAILTRSILATVVVSIGIVIIEGLIGLLGLFFYARAPGLTQFLIETTPPFHVQNIKDLAFSRSGAEMILSPDVVLNASLGASLATVAAWSVAALAVAMVAFLRQDMN